MIAVDTNVLVYAHRKDMPHHERAFAEVRALAEGSAQWAIPWPCVHEFYAVVTNRRIFRKPSPPEQAWRQLDAWFGSPRLRLLAEAHNHAEQLRALTLAAGVIGAQVHDARIAALCLEHGVSELLTLDRDFSRFPQLATRSLISA
jgi:uncharacterized protein